MAIQHQEAVYYGIVFLVSALAGTSRCIRDGQYRSLFNLCAVAGVSGFLGFAVVAVSADRSSSPDFNGLFYLGVAAIIGLAGKEQTQLINLIWTGVLKRIFPELGERENDNQDA